MRMFVCVCVCVCVCLCVCVLSCNQSTSFPIQIGTEEEPYLGEAEIVLHGHLRAKELPIFGAKTLAVRNGSLELHGM